MKGCHTQGFVSLSWRHDSLGLSVTTVEDGKSLNKILSVNRSIKETPEEG